MSDIQLSDYQCEFCGKVFEFMKRDINKDFPKELPCPECKGTSTRIYGLGNISVGQGMLGNSKNGYSNEITYHPNSLVGKMKGKRVK